MAKGVTVWFTGLSGAGQSTIAREVAAELRRRGLCVEVLDGDVVRQGLCSDLGFFEEDRRRDFERLSFVAGLLTRHGVITLVALVVPDRAARARARRKIGSFVEVYVRAGPEIGHPDLMCDTDREPLAECAVKVVRLLEERGFIPAASTASLPGPSVPHGGTLVWRTLEEDARAAALERALSLPSIRLDELALSDLELIGTGALSPLEGFMGRADYECVVEGMRLASGLVWPLPVTLAVSRREVAGLREGGEVALVDGHGRPAGLMKVTEIFTYDKEREARLVFG
ncbi:MAG TPA: adenylyl-sulfate kinase, partial [Thermaerobacter sp.]